MLQDLTIEQIKQLNPDDVTFANANAPRIHDEWKQKFINGAAQHGGIGKSSLVERKGLIREALCEHYDGISYTLAIEKRLELAKAKLRVVRDVITSTDMFDTGILRYLDEVIDLLS